MRWMIVGTLFVSAAGFSGCRSIIEEPTHAERPDFLVSELSVAVGETVLLPVINASSIELLTFGEIIDVTIEGYTLSVTGLEPGVTTITLRADGQTIRCDVTVYDDGNSDVGEPEDVRLQNLADGSVRATFGKLSLRLDTPGTIFKCSSDGKTVNVIALSSGENLTLVLDKPLSALMAGESLGAVSLFVNGNPQPIYGSEVEKVADGKLWLRLLSPTASSVCRFVIPVTM